MANQTLYNIINGIATTARTNGDQSTFAVMEELWQRAYWNFLRTDFNYDASTASSSPQYVQNVPMVVTSAISPSFDTEMNMGLTNIKQLGG